MANKRAKSWFSLIPEKIAQAPSTPPARPRRSTLDWKFGAEKGPVWERADTSTFARKPAEQPPVDDVPARPANGVAARRSSVEGEKPLIDLVRTEPGARRAMAIRLAMDEALERWWTDGELPPLALLRDGLLLLEAGYALDETQRSFLLRVALRRQRGMITALRHQSDPDRTAFLLKDALLDAQHPLPGKLVMELQQEDAQSAIWMDYLLHDLAYELGVAQGKRRQLAVKALAQMKPKARLWGIISPVTRAQTETLPLSHRWSLRWLLWAICVLALLVGYIINQRAVYVQSVQIPAGSYTISDPLGDRRTRTVVLAAFQIDVTEVTNGAYQRCSANGACAPPGSEASATHERYFTASAYRDFPVVTVDWDGAASYCAWLGKRLPTLEEWEVAAAIAPVTQRYFRYPWGDHFDPHLVNGGSPLALDTREVGAFHPVGDSSFGLRDMTGNVAEWTATPSADLFNGFVVKGGSYRDDGELLRLDAQQDLARTTQEPWLGFRCVRD